MHDRRIDGKAHTFGNFGDLYKSAMTWFDHETDSVWSQPIGTSIIGPYAGVRLEAIPASVMPWGTWKRDHPDTLVLAVRGLARAFVTDPFDGRRGEYVLGIELGEHAKAYPFDAVSEDVVANDRIGDVPVLVYANPDDRSAHIYVRRARDMDLEFVWSGGELRDRQTNSLWEPAKGFAIEGELRGELLRKLHYITAYQWAWEDFYPHTEVFRQ